MLPPSVAPNTGFGSGQDQTAFLRRWWLIRPWFWQVSWWLVAWSPFFERPQFNALYLLYLHTVEHELYELKWLASLMNLQRNVDKIYVHICNNNIFGIFFVLFLIGDVLKCGILKIKSPAPKSVDCPGPEVNV